MYPKEIVDVEIDNVYELNYYFNFSNLDNSIDDIPGFNIIYKEVQVYVYYSNQHIFAVVNKNFNDFFKFNISAYKLENIGYTKDIWKLYIGKEDISKSMLYFIYEFIDQIDNKNKDIYKPHEIISQESNDLIVSSDDESESFEFDE